MKRLLSIIIAATALAVATLCAASSDAIKWNETSHDFGTIHASGGKVTAQYTFVNNGKEPAAILSMTNGGCGCTVPSYPKKPIAAGGTGTVTITFDPARFKGEFKRQVTVTIQAGDKRVKSRLKFNGHIIPD